MTDRIIALIDMDCFYCQVEARLNPELNGKPMAVVQYNTWKGGGIIAVNYEARNFGVTRHLRGNEAKLKCPEIALVHVPELRGKADLTKYRDAGREVVNVLVQFSDCVERASVDEAYIDLTQAVEKYIKNMNATVTLEQLPNTYVVGFSEDENNDEGERVKGLNSWLSEQMHDPLRLKLAVAGVIVEEMRAAVYKQTQFRCSAGIGHNKVLAKLVCCLHKPNKQTLLPQEQVDELFRRLPVKKVRNLGGKLGVSVVEQLGCKVMADLQRYTESQLQTKFDFKTGSWLYNIARGIDSDPVTPRLLAKSIGCCKAFKGTQGLITEASVTKWMLDLSKELAERLVKEQEENKRVAKLLTVSFMLGDASSTRSGTFNSMEAERISADAIELIRRSNADKWTTPIHYLGVSAGKFSDESKNSIQNFFKTVDKVPTIVNGSVEKIKSRDTSEPKVENPDSKSPQHSFFMKFFKKRSSAVPSEPAFDDIVQESKPGTSNEGSSNNQDTFAKTARNNEPMRLTDEPIPGCSKDFFPEETSNSNDSIMWTSLGEIFPDISAVDDNVAALLPLSMQKQLAYRRKGVDANEKETKGKLRKNKPDLQTVKEAPNDVEGLRELSKSLDESGRRRSSKAIEADHTAKLNIPSQTAIVSRDVYHMDESTDVDDDLFCESENPLVETNSNSPDGSSTSSAPSFLRLGFSATTDQTRARASPEIISSTSDCSQSNIRGQLCKVCAKHILLNDYLEHLDFHAAEALHQELNNANSGATARTSSATNGGSKKSPTKAVQLGGKKRGRPSKSSVASRSDNKRLRSITSFFAPNK